MDQAGIKLSGQPRGIDHREVTVLQLEHSLGVIPWLGAEVKGWGRSGGCSWVMKAGGWGCLGGALRFHSEPGRCEQQYFSCE